MTSMGMTAARLKWGFIWLLGRSRGGRNFPVFPDDVFIVSYPRSGNTWMRFLIANLIYSEETITFANIEQKIPDVYKNTRRQLLQTPRPRLLKSHEYFDPRYKKVIYIARDPRDVAVSYYHFDRKRKKFGDSYPLERYIARFIAGTVDDYGSWKENVASWLATRRGSESFLLLRYEDMLEHGAVELAKVASFLGMERSPEQVARAVELSSADRMRDLEKKQAGIWVTTREARKDIPFVRAAHSGGWRSSLSPNLVAAIETAWRPLMESLGYELAATWGDRAGPPGEEVDSAIPQGAATSIMVSHVQKQAPMDRDGVLPQSAGVSPTHN
jgi:hypothetical protein